MSPERLEGLDYSYPSDIWSLGIVVYEMTMGDHPYPKTDNPLEIHGHIKQNDAPTLIGLGAVSIELADFVDKCLQKDPSKRFDAQQLMEHPFIQFFNNLENSNDDHISWLVEYNERKDNIANINSNMQIDMNDLGLSIGLAS